MAIPWISVFPKLENIEFMVDVEAFRKTQPVSHRFHSTHNDKGALPELAQLPPHR